MKILLVLPIAFSLNSSCLAEEKTVPQKTAPTSPVPAATSSTKPDPDSHEGIWKPIAGVMGGVRLSAPALEAITLKINGNQYEVTIKGEPMPDKGTCVIDLTTTPKRMTIKGTDGPNRGKTFLAIFEKKDAKSMRVCYDLSGTDFPKDFKAPKGTQLYLVGYRRQAE